MRKRGIVVAFSLLIIFAAGAVAASTSEKMASRDIGCAAFDGRSLEICQHIAAHLEWTWFGHAALSPGWRVTASGIGDIWCAARITAKDKQHIEIIEEKSKDWRLESTAASLLILLRGREGQSIGGKNSVFHPANPSYVLKGKCG